MSQLSIECVVWPSQVSAISGLVAEVGAGFEVLRGEAEAVRAQLTAARASLEESRAQARGDGDAEDSGMEGAWEEEEEEAALDADAAYLGCMDAFLTAQEATVEALPDLEQQVGVRMHRCNHTDGDMCQDVSSWLGEAPRHSLCLDATCLVRHRHASHTARLCMPAWLCAGSHVCDLLCDIYRMCDV